MLDRSYQRASLHISNIVGALTTENTMNNRELDNNMSFYILLFRIREESYWSVISDEEASVRDS